MNRILLLLLLAGIFPTGIFSQTLKELNSELKNADHDTIKCRILLELMEVENDKFRNEASLNKLLALTEKNLKNPKSDREKKQFKHYQSEGYLKKGFFLKYDGDIKNALSYYHKALTIKEELGEKNSIAILYNNIGIIYRQQNAPDIALNYFDKSYRIFKKMNDIEGMSNALNSMGSLHSQMGKYKQALQEHEQSIRYSRITGDFSLVAMNYLNIGYAYDCQNKLDQAITYYTKSLQVNDSIDDKLGVAIAGNFIGATYLKQKDYPKAKKQLESSLQLAQELGFPETIRGVTLKLYQVYEALGDYKKAFETHELYVEMKDSIYNDGVNSALLEQQLKYDFAKKTAADSVKAVEEKKVVAAQFKKEQTQRYALYAGLVLVLVFSAFIYNRFRITNRQKKIIEIKEQETQEQNALIISQKQIIEERHKEITDSINYAERIQRSFLASAETLNKFLPEYFIFFKPKDIVSGDFYWASELKNGQFALVTADSTGHGVPGAIMSLLNITSLEKAVDAHNEPAEILNHTRNNIIERLRKDGSPDGGKDGMDCSICVYDFNNLQVRIAAANNPVWIVRNGELTQIEPDKMPVGKFHNQGTLFSQSEFQLEKDDIVYTITDGFQDQFGGETGKKFKTKNLRDLLASIATLPLQKQAEKLEETFQNWKGNLEQIDDVCIIGVRV